VPKGGAFPLVNQCLDALCRYHRSKKCRCSTPYGEEQILLRGDKPYSGNHTEGMTWFVPVGEWPIWVKTRRSAQMAGMSGLLESGRSAAA
jgi:hypothetical protein